MNNLRIGRYERIFLTFSGILMVFVSITAIIVLYYAVSSKESIIKSLDEFYIILMPLIFIFLILFLFGFIGFAAVGLKILFYNPIREKKDVLEVTPDEIKVMNEVEKDFLLQQLKEKKERIEYLIRLAEEKYHTRKLDSESFREIVRDNQKKIMDIEVKMTEINEKLKELK